MMMVEIIFWTSVGLILYTYFGYPVLLYLLSVFKNNPVRRESIRPRVTIIIAAHNEEGRIRGKIENTLSLNYPTERREIIVASDGSTDRTHEIVCEYKDRGVILVAPSERKGKEYAQWQAIQVATGEILVFSDVATLIGKDSLLHIVSNFHDPTVGCVSSEDEILTETETTAGEGFYVKYEMLLRRLESRVNSLVGLSGSFFAVRREICQEWANDMDSDFATVFRAVKKGYRAVSDSTAVGFYPLVSSLKREFQRKVRTVLRGISGLAGHMETLNPFRYGFFSIQVLSHKLLRWSVPLFMVSAFASNIFLAANFAFYRWLLAGQVVFYSLAVLGLLAEKFNRSILFKVPTFFTMVNITIAVAWIKYLSGHRALQWEPSKR